MFDTNRTFQDAVDACASLSFDGCDSSIVDPVNLQLVGNAVGPETDNQYWIGCAKKEGSTDWIVSLKKSSAVLDFLP